MIRILSILVGLFFSAALAWSVGLGAYSYVTDPPKQTVEQAFHLHPHEPAGGFSFNGLFGKFDNQQLQRGFKVYSEVCANCHALKHVAFRDLKAIGYNDDEVKAIAGKYQIPEYNAATGEVASHAGLAKDYFPPVIYAGSGHPPDLSLMTKARHDGANYVYSLLTGYADQPAELLKRFPDAKTPDGLYYNPYFANLNLAMPAIRMAPRPPRNRWPPMSQLSSAGRRSPNSTSASRPVGPCSASCCSPRCSPIWPTATSGRARRDTEPAASPSGS